MPCGMLYTDRQFSAMPLGELRLAFCLILGGIHLSQVSSSATVGSPAGQALQDLPPPQHVNLDAVAEHSFTLSWKAPPLKKNAPRKFVAYSLLYSAVSGPGRVEKELLLPPTANTKMVSGLKEGTEYVVVLAAVYDTGNFERSPAAKLYVTTKLPLMDFPVADDTTYVEGEPECNCSEKGVYACTRKPHSFECACYPGYEGKWCESCSPGYYQDNKECKFCPCSNITSSGRCALDQNGQLMCVGCAPGHRGSLCDKCSAGYQWKDDRCLPINCISFSLCVDNDSHGCRDCAFLEQNSLPSTARRSNGAERAAADGTIPLIAVIVTLGVILMVALGATCYRYWWQRRTRPRLPFWSIELREEKVNFSSDCQYQHLDAASSKVVQADITEPEADALPQPSPRVYNTVSV